jgi:hypothetical protein
MPIRINLLAEQQAAEDARRRDPVKRGIWAGALVVVIVIMWSVLTQIEVMSARSELANEDGRWQKVEKQFYLVTTNRAVTMGTERKLESLHRMAAERFLWGQPLDALQRATLADVRIAKIAGVQTHSFAPGTRSITNGTTVVLGKKAAATEKAILTVEARDFGSSTDQNILKFRRILEEFPYFKANLVTNGVNLLGFSEPQPDENDRKKVFVSFTLECRYPDKVRH